MNKMTKQNLANIKDRFERETGTSVQPQQRHLPAGRILVLAVLVTMGIMLTAFAVPLFSPLDGDALSLEGTYLGDGIVSVRVENRSEKVLTFTDAVLYSWNDGEVAMLPGGRVVLTEVRVEPHGEGILTVDLSGAYDIGFLESTTPGKPRDSWYYLLLTNQNFLFGHDWMCSFSFGEEEVAMETESVGIPEGTAQSLDGIAEELRFYFEQGYPDVIPAFNEANFTYQQRVEELLMRTPGTHVRPVDPPLFMEEQGNPVDQRYSSLDGYRRMVGSCFSGVTSEFVLQVGAWENDGDDWIPLVFLAVYETRAVQQEEAYTFLYGRILPFGDLEKDKVYEGEGYTVYDVTDLYYTDLEDYLHDFFEDPDCGEWEAIRDAYRNPGNLRFSLLSSED